MSWTLDGANVDFCFSSGVPGLLFPESVWVAKAVLPNTAIASSFVAFHGFDQFMLENWLLVKKVVAPILT